jgi:plasmid stabilization system protein ParE
MILRYSPRAQSDLNTIFEYLDQRSPSGARNVMRAIYASIQFLAEYPDASQATNGPNVRVKIVTRYSFKIFYRVDGDTIIEIIHVRHAARRPWL